MATIKLDVVTAERQVYSGDVDEVIAPGVEGQLAILPHHAPLMTMLQPGELTVKKGADEVCIAVTGGFLEVRPNRVIILADAAERDDEIDVRRAEEAKVRAEERLKAHGPALEVAQAEAALHRAMARLAVVEKRNRRRGV